MNELDKKFIFLRTKSLTQEHDTFTFYTPSYDEYLELSTSLDSREYIDLLCNKLSNTNNAIDLLNDFKEGISTIALRIRKLILNCLRGKVRAEKLIYEIVPHRQVAIAKVGMISSLLHLITIISAHIEEYEMNQDIIDKLALPKAEFDGYGNLIEILFHTLLVCVANNQDNRKLLINSAEMISKFIYVRGCRELIIEIFKDTKYQVNKKEIHSEVLYKRVYEIERYESIIEMPMEKLSTTKNYNFIILLRHLCMIEGNPLTLVQNKVFKKLYDKNSFKTRFTVTPSADRSDVSLMSNSSKGGRSTIDTYSSLNDSEKEFLLQQLGLEADL